MKNRSHILYILFVLIIFFSCEEPNDPPIIYNPEIPKVIGKSISSIDIFWNEADIDNFDRYEIYYKKYFEEEYKLYITIPNQKQVFVSVSGLTPDTEYKFYVKVYDKNGKYWITDIKSEKTFSDIPSTIKKFVVSDYGYDYILLQWSTYEDSYAVPFDRYEVFMGTTSNFPCNDSTRVLVNKLIYTDEGRVVGLSDKQGYYFKLRVYNSLGKYRESSAIYARTLNEPPKPVIFYEAENITENSAVLKWQKSNDPEFQKYTLHLGSDPEFTPSSKNLLITFTNVSDTSLTVTGLKRGEGYIYKVVIYDKYLDYAVSNPVGFNAFKDGIPPAVEILDLKVSSDNITVIWEEEELKLFSRYDLYRSTDSLDLVNNKGLAVSITDQIKTSYTFSNLKRGMKYFFKVRRVNIFGKGESSQIKSVVLQ